MPPHQDVVFTASHTDFFDVLCGALSFVIGESSKIPKAIKYILKGLDIGSAAKVISTDEDVSQKLSFFIQQYPNEGAEEDAWKKVVCVSGLFGGVLGVLSLLGMASSEQNRYQIVQYDQRRAFIAEAGREMERIERLIDNVCEKDMEREIKYVHFLQHQKNLIEDELELNKVSDAHQNEQIRYNLQMHGMGEYEDRRAEWGAGRYHEIDYRKIYEEEACAN